MITLHNMIILYNAKSTPRWYTMLGEKMKDIYNVFFAIRMLTHPAYIKDGEETLEYSHEWDSRWESN